VQKLLRAEVMHLLLSSLLQRMNAWTPAELQYKVRYSFKFKNSTTINSYPPSFVYQARS